MQVKAITENNIKKKNSDTTLKKSYFIDENFSLLPSFGLELNCRVYVTKFHENKKRKRSYIDIRGILNNKKVRFNSKAKLMQYLKQQKILINGSNYHFNVDEFIEQKRKKILGRKELIKNQFAQTPNSVFEYFKFNNLKISLYDPAPVQPTFDALDEACDWIENSDAFVYINPPYNNILEYVKKLKIELLKNHLSKSPFY